jgi:hypothetical protein
MEDMVAAANSAWIERGRWRDGGDGDYSGLTECPATINIKQKEMVDAIVIPIYMTGHPNPSLCEYSNQDRIAERLQFAHDFGYESLPVLFYKESQGSIRLADCRRLWGGTACSDGFQREFFSQEFKFPNGACVHRPPGCNETYFFPPQDVSDPGAGCSAFSDDSNERIAMLSSNEVNMAAWMNSRGPHKYVYQLRQTGVQPDGLAVSSMTGSIGLSLACSSMTLGAVLLLYVKRLKQVKLQWAF